MNECRLNSSFLKIAAWLGAALLLLSTFNAHAFALLGPVQPWMQATNGVIQPGDIGGPMEIGSGYRWNVPVVTYGFDQSFLDYFGTNGVAAVESAIKILNDLPPASNFVPTDYPHGSVQVNYQAQDQSLLDLKSQTLAMLIKQLGLAQPTRSVYVIHQWNPILLNYSKLVLSWYYETTNDVVFNYIDRLNYDPQTLEPTAYINDALYTGAVASYAGVINMIEIYPVDPLAYVYAAVADRDCGVGCFYSGLTRDDVGGLCYLLSTNNVNFEPLLPDVQSVGTSSFVNGAWRPGVDKITFVPQPVGSLPGTFLPMTNQFTDTYYTNSHAIQQQLQRVTTQPDFLFSAGNDTARTGTTNWINNAVLNTNSTGAGPGTIQPPIVITFQKMGHYFYSSSSDSNPVIWSEDSVQDIGEYHGSFDGSTNAPIVYPVSQTGNVAMTLRVLLSHSNNLVNNFHRFEWSPTSQTGTVYALQTSTNLTAWNTLFVVTNNGSVCTYQNVNANSSSRFYRLVPQ